MPVVTCENVKLSGVLMNCGVRAVLTVLEYMGLDKPHLLLGDDNAAFYVRSGTLGYITASYRHTVTGQLAEYGIIQHEFHSDSEEDVWQAIIEGIGRGTPLLFYCNTSYLPYFPTYNTAHLTIVRGYDSDTRQVFIREATQDDRLTWRDFIRAITMDNPEMARQVGAKKTFRWETLDPAGARPVGADELLARVRENQAYLLGQKPLGEPSRRRLLELWQMPADSEVHVGWDSLLRYAHELPDLYADPEPWFAHRSHLMVFDFWQQRRVLSEILIHLGAILDRPDLTQAAARLEEANKSWVVMRGVVMKQHLRPSALNLVAMARRIERVTREEREALAGLDLGPSPSLRHQEE